MYPSTHAVKYRALMFTANTAVLLSSECRRITKAIGNATDRAILPQTCGKEWLSMTY